MRLLTLAAAFVAGIWLADGLEISVPGLSLLALAGFLGIALLFSLRRSILPALLVIAVVAGAPRLGVDQRDAFARRVGLLHHGRDPGGQLERAFCFAATRPAGQANDRGHVFTRSSAKRKRHQ